MLKIKKQAMIFAMVDFSGGVPAELDLLGTFFSPGLLPPLSQSASRKGTGRDVHTIRRLRGLPSEVPLHGCGQGLNVQMWDKKSIPENRVYASVWSRRDTTRRWVLASHPDQAKTKQWGPFLNP